MSKYMIRYRKPPSQTWRTFLENHATDIFAIDFLTVPTATLRVLFVLVILSHGRQKIAALGLVEVTTAPRSPWQNPYVERMIGSIRRECLNHTIIVGERHLRRVVANYLRYYNSVRTHMSLAKDAPDPRPIHGPRRGRIVRRPHCGGLHHEYRRKAAYMNSNNHVRRCSKAESG